MTRADCSERDRGNHPVIGFILASLLIAVFSATVAHADADGRQPVLVDGHVGPDALLPLLSLLPRRKS